MQTVSQQLIQRPPSMSKLSFLINRLAKEYLRLLQRLLSTKQDGGLQRLSIRKNKNSIKMTYKSIRLHKKTSLIVLRYIIN